MRVYPASQREKMASIQANLEDSEKAMMMQTRLKWTHWLDSHPLKHPNLSGYSQRLALGLWELPVVSVFVKTHLSAENHSAGTYEMDSWVQKPAPTRSQRNSWGLWLYYVILYI